jgi:hypothetical protein
MIHQEESPSGVAASALQPGLGLGFCAVAFRCSGDWHNSFEFVAIVVVAITREGIRHDPQPVSIAEV